MHCCLDVLNAACGVQRACDAKRMVPDMTAIYALRMLCSLEGRCIVQSVGLMQ